MNATEQTSWATAPEDTQAAIIAVKKKLRAQIGDVGALYAKIEAAMELEVADIIATKERGEDVWPVVQFADIAAGTVPQAQLDLIHRRGCAIIRGQVPVSTATDWDSSLVEYVDGNGFDAVYRGPADDFFGTLAASRPEIYPIYWSAAQMEARQHENTAKVQSFLNAQWKYESDGTVWFDPDQDSMYPDRIRRRPPGTTSNGLGAHTDSGSIERWLTPAYQEVFASLFHGDFESYDPWDAAHRTEVDEYPSSTMCSVFRSFQGWLALSEMRHDQGVLHVVPVPSAMAYMLIRPLLDDVPDDSLCDATQGKALGANEKWHPLLMEAVSGIPDVQPGDSVWWHSDLIHSVAPVTDQEGWGNVIYIPAAPPVREERAVRGGCRRAFPARRESVRFPQGRLRNGVDQPIRREGPQRDGGTRPRADTLARPRFAELDRSGRP